MPPTSSWRRRRLARPVSTATRASMPGIFVQTTVFGAMLTGTGLAYDLQSGILDRFKSLPMSRSAVLIGRTVTDALRNVFVILLMLVVGYLVGFRIHGTFLQTLAAI